MRALFKIILLFLFFTLCLFSYKYRKHLPFVGKYFKKTVSQTISQIEKDVSQRLLDQGVPLNKLNNKTPLTFLILKDEKTVNILARIDEKNILLTKYDMTAFSGTMGPKNKEGDLQIPEGIYAIEGLNPNSLFYLSLKLNFPNAIDLERAKINKIDAPGSNIFIHGKNKTVGCVPIGDQAIEELFYLTHLVGRENIRVLLAPTFDLARFDFKRFAKNDEDLVVLEKKYKALEAAILELFLN